MWVRDFRWQRTKILAKKCVFGVPGFFFFYVLTAVPKLGGLREGGRGSTMVSPASVSVHAHAGPWADLETLQLKNVL